MRKKGKPAQRMKWKKTAAVLTVLCLFGVSPAYGENGQELRIMSQQLDEETKEKQPEDSLNLNAQAAVLMDGDTGRVLYGKNEGEVRPMASTTKIMTCILALEKGQPEDLVTASGYAASQPQVHMGVREGENYYLKDLLYGLMLESYNDAAVMIAEHIGGSVEEFAGMMNQKARELGCRNTCFITPNGLDAVLQMEDKSQKTHSTTAEELAKIMAYCVNTSPKREEFLKITQSQNHIFSDMEGKRSFSCVNHNTLLSSMEGMISGKTGFTSGAGYSYVGAVESEGRSFIIAILGCGWPPHKNLKWTDAAALIRYGKEYFHLKDFPLRTELPQIPVEGGVYWKNENRLELKAETLEKQNILLGDWEHVTCRLVLPQQASAPVREGQQMGKLEYLAGGEVLCEVPVCAAKSLEALNLPLCIGRGMELFLKL